MSKPGIGAPREASRRKSGIMSNRSIMPDMAQTENLYIGCKDGWLYEWKVVEKSMRKKGKVMENEIKVMELTNDKKTIYIGDRYGHLKRVGIDPAQPFKVEKEYDAIHMNNISGLALSKNNTYLYTASWDATVKKINLTTQEVDNQWENSSR
jgi:WD40 repeat protein